VQKDFLSLDLSRTKMEGTQVIVFFLGAKKISFLPMKARSGDSLLGQHKDNA
jgi:hypothetical protein